MAPRDLLRVSHNLYVCCDRNGHIDGCSQAAAAVLDTRPNPSCTASPVLVEAEPKNLTRRDMLGFDSLILNVDWARPSADGEQRGGYRGGGGGGGGGDRGDRGGDRGGGYGDRGGGGGYGDRGGGYGDRGGGDRGGGYGDRGDRGGGYGGRSMADSNASRFGRDRDAPSAADSGPWRR